MSQFIIVNDKHQGIPTSVNITNILFIYPRDGGCRIDCIGQKGVEVTNTHSEVLHKIEDLQISKIEFELKVKRNFKANSQE